MSRFPNPLSPDPDNVSVLTGVSFVGTKSRTQQHFRDETDINVLVRRFAKIGLPPPPLAPEFVDFSESFDFQAAMDQVVYAREAFASLDSNTRAYFANDPARLVRFLADAGNRSEAVRLGLVAAPPPAPLDQVSEAAPDVSSGTGTQST